MKRFEDFQRAVRGSKQYSFNGTVLELMNYYTGERFKLDLNNVTEEMFEELISDEDDEDEEDWL